MISIRYLIGEGDQTRAYKSVITFLHAKINRPIYFIIVMLPVLRN